MRRRWRGEPTTEKTKKKKRQKDGTRARFAEERLDERERKFTCGASAMREARERESPRSRERVTMLERASGSALSAADRERLSFP